jgi:hypothetical protein
MASSMDQLRWSDAEKKIARRAFEKALQQELDEVIHEVKEMARDIKEPPDLWKLEDYLTRRRKAIDSTYDYRYSQLPIVFGQLARKGQIRGFAGIGRREVVVCSLHRGPGQVEMPSSQ